MSTEPSRDHRDQVVLHVVNHHVDPLPSPIEIGRHDYVGYFMNEHLEQWVFVRNLDEDHATIHGGDLGWERIIRNLDAQPIVVVPGIGAVLGDNILNEIEARWVQTCWDASKYLADFRRRERAEQQRP